MTTITVTRTTKEKLRSFGKMGQSYDELLNDMLEHIDFCDRWWEVR